MDEQVFPEGGEAPMVTFRGAMWSSMVETEVAGRHDLVVDLERRPG